MSTKYERHVVAICPAAAQKAVNALCEAEGWGPGTFSIPLSETGDGLPSHFGMATFVTREVESFLRKHPAAAALHLSFISARSMKAKGHFEREIERLGLRIVEPEEDAPVPREIQTRAEVRKR